MKTTTPNAWPHSALPAKPEQPGKPLWSSLYYSGRRVLSVAWCEMLLQWHALAAWVMLAVFTLLTALYAHSQVTVSTRYISNGQAAVAICGYAASFILFLLPFLFINIFERDRQRKMHQLVWTRPLASLEYALGKGVGVIGVSLVLAWLPLIAGWLTASLARGEIQPLGLWLPMFLVVGAATILVTLFALLCIVLTSPLGLLGALLTAGAVVYIDVIFVKSMLFLNNLTATTLFLSPSIGFGPDGNLLLWQRISYVLGGLCCLGLVVLVYQVRERLGIVHLRHWLSTALLIIVASGTVFASISTFQTAGASYTDAGLMTAKPVQATTSHYKIDVNADPASGEVQGSASFLLTPQGKLGASFVIALNAGLHVSQVTAQTATGGSTQLLHFVETSAGWTSINIQGTSLVNGLPLNLNIQYAGRMVLGRDDYRAPASGYGHGGGFSWEQSFFYLSFLGQGVGELLGAAGSWYPLPFTQQALDAGTRIPIDELHLRFPTSYKVWSSVGSATPMTDGHWQEIVAQPHAGLPVALAVALNSAQQGNVNGRSFWYQGSAPDPTQLLTYGLTIQETQVLNAWLAPTSMPATFQTVVVPILPFPVVGPGLLLIPETLGDNGLDPLNSSPYTSTVIARYMALHLTRSWWTNAGWFPFTSLLGGSSTQNVDPSTSIAPTNALLEMLAEYSAVVVTDKVIGANFFTSEMQVCSQEYALPPNAGFSSETQKLQQEMALLGTTCVFSELVPFRLQLIPTVGFTGLTSFLQHYAQAHAQQKTDMRDFLHQASVLAGKDIVNEAAPYICPAGLKAVPTGPNSDPLACLNVQYSGT